MVAGVKFCLTFVDELELELMRSKLTPWTIRKQQRRIQKNIHFLFRHEEVTRIATFSENPLQIFNAPNHHLKLKAKNDPMQNEYYNVP